jgi:hypothetical protein
MNDSMWEAVAEAAFSINAAIDGPFGSFRGREVRRRLYQSRHTVLYKIRCFARSSHTTLIFSSHLGTLI